MSGRAGRSEYWYFQLFIIVSSAVALTLDIILFGWATLDTDSGGPFWMLSGIVLFFPQFTVFVRRLHDVGKPFFYIIIPLITFAAGISAGAQFGGDWGEGVGVVVFAISASGFLYLLILTLLPSQDFGNKYGPPPNLQFIKKSEEQDIGNQ